MTFTISFKLYILSVLVEFIGKAIKLWLLEKLTYKKVMTWGKKDVNIIKDQAKKVSKIDYEKNF